MKFIICLVLTAACAEALAWSRDVRSTEGCGDPAQKIWVPAGQILPDAIVSDTEDDGRYPLNACQEWNVFTYPNKCIVISVGSGGFSTGYLGTDFVLFKDLNSLTETRQSGSLGGLLFRSDTNSVNVRFTSSNLLRFRGFTMDVRSTSCDSVQEVVVAAKEVLEDAIVTDTASDGLYPDRAVQSWRINTEENQCIAITVGQGGFDTQYDFDFVVFKDQNSNSGVHREGEYPPTYVLFTSETNSVDVTFTSDSTTRRSGFSLDIRSASCVDLVNLEEENERFYEIDENCDANVQKVKVAAGQVLEGAIVSDTDSDGLYPNNACQVWDIFTDDNQCIVINVGGRFFSTDSRRDIVIFKDSNSLETTRHYGFIPGTAVLFTSETNSVDVRFISDFRDSRTGFTLDVRSTDCTDGN